jgi:hypothetical protein
MIGKRFDDIVPDDLTALVNNAVREGRTIEYKKVLPDGSDAGKKEFLADVSSFANSMGGDLVYGVEAKDGLPIRLAGLQGFDPDKDTLRFESIIRDGLDPRVPGLRTKVIDVPSAGPVFVIRVMRSWAGPHMVTFKDSSKFFARSSAGKFQMDTGELRSAFSLAADLPARIRAWRDNRLAKIIVGDTPIPIAESAKMVLHLVPLDSLIDSGQIPATVLNGKQIEFGPMWSSSWNHRLNLDGYVTHGGRPYGDKEGVERSYCQVFRSGQVEAVSADLVREVHGRKIIASISYEKMILESTARYLKSLDSVGVQPPMLVMVAFISARGATMGVGISYGGDLHPIDRDPLILPDVLIAETPKNLPRALRLILDAAWNACGAPQSPNYDKNGRWAAEQLRDVPMEATS